MILVVSSLKHQLMLDLLLRFCPNNELPHVLKTTMEYPTWHPPRIGMKREFLVRPTAEGKDIPETDTVGT